MRAAAFLMQDAETKALMRAAMLLVLVSALRWGWSARARPAPSESDSVLPELLAESREAADEGDRRAEPLGEGERVDANRADEVDLDRLPGVGPATARAIAEAREGGAVFRSPSDLLGVRGIGAATLERIRPFLTLADPPAGRVRSPARAVRDLVDVNRADLDRLQSLPGIGPAIAGRIVAERRERMFMSLEDLVRVRGIGAATLERLRALATVGRRP